MLFITTAAGILAAVVLYRENQALREELSRRIEVERPMPGPNEPEPERVFPVEVSLEPPAAVEPTEPVPEPRPGREDRAARFLRMMDDPDVQAAMRERSKSGVERRYAGLFRSLGLDEETIEVFKELMAEKEMVQRRAAIESRMALEGEGPDILFLAELDLERLDQSLVEVLGEDAHDTFTYFQETLSERQAVEDLTRLLSYSGTPLAQDRAEQLVGVMAGAEEAFVYTNDLSQLSGRERARVPAEDVALYIEERRSLNESVLSEASTVLAPDQLEALAEQQMREVETLERQAAMGGMRGGGGPGGGGGRGPGGG